VRGQKYSIYIYIYIYIFNNSKFTYIQTNYLSWLNRNFTHFILYTINKPLDLCDEISSIDTPDDGKEIMPKHVV
jgi:hypothetical protein